MNPMMVDTSGANQGFIKRSGVSPVIWIIVALLVVGVFVVTFGFSANPATFRQLPSPATFNQNEAYAPHMDMDVCYTMTKKEARALDKACRTQCKSEGARILFWNTRKRKKCEGDCFKARAKSANYC
jgi:hypothetical protein